ncbi:YesK family protein [Priestia megaterium]|uniref:YesK family protein n=1 Tax=Priestia megaterium TaxID=1404 RepID=UPI0025A39B87|nr:YesK family protein [Priestia megaterium]MDM8151119.1 YesK family protein [Priestia megaterium]
MDIKLILVTIITALVLAYIFHSVQRKRNSDKHIGDKVFNIGFVISLTIIAISILVVGGWDGMVLGAIGAYLLFPSLSGLIFTKLLMRYS